MPFTVAFSVAQSQDGQTLTVTDNSVYTSPDNLANISNRTVSIHLYDGTFLGVSDPIPFPIVSGQNDVLQVPITKDYAIAVTMTDTPVSAQVGSVYTLTKDYVLLNNSKLKYYSREFRLDSGLVQCEEDYAQVDYSILRWIQNAGDRYFNSDQEGSQKFLDKIFAVGLNDCVC